MKMRTAKALAIQLLALAGCLSAFAASGPYELALTDNITIDVAAGETYTITNLTGYGWRLTKTGPGKLAIHAIANERAKITVEEGTLEMVEVENVLPAVAQEAFFHVDATAASSLQNITTENGTNFVATWKDVRGDGHPYATSAGKSQHKPFLAKDSSGRDVVDFGGTWQDANANIKGHGAAMNWSEGLTRPMDIFVVEQHNDDMREVIRNASADSGNGYRNQAILGNNYSSGSLIIPGNTDSGEDSTSLLYQNPGVIAYQYNFQFYVDAAPVTATSYYPGYDWHVYGIQPSEQYFDDAGVVARVNSFARERSTIFGGQRIAEFVAFTNRILTASEREAMTRYLYVKWKCPLVNTLAELVMKSGTTLSMPAGSNLAPQMFIDEGSSVSGAGEFSPRATISASSVTATAGEVVHDPLLSADAWFHVDASQTNLLGITSDNPTNVYCWSDVRGRKSVKSSDMPSDGGRYASLYKAGDYPFLNVGYLNGLPVMDFGPIAISSQSTPDDNVKRSFLWNEDCKEARTILVVVGDNEKAKERHSDGKRNQPFIGSSGTFILRPDRSSDSVNSPYIHAGAGAGSGTKFWCDGNAVSSPTTEAYPDGMHLVTIEPQNVYAGNANAHCNAFAIERSNLYGGQRIAECLVFTNKLSDVERNTFETLMLAKWFGSNGVARAYANVTVATNASLAMMYQRLSVTGKLTLGGTLKAEQVQVGDGAEIELTAPAAIDGTLALPESSAATIVLNGSAWSEYRDEKIKVIGATKTTGRKPVGRLNPNPRGRSVSFSIEEDGIYATFASGGFTIIFK